MEKTYEPHKTHEINTDFDDGTEKGHAGCINCELTVLDQTIEQPCVNHWQKKAEDNGNVLRT